MEEEYIKIIEELYSEEKKIFNSKQYIIGNKLLKFKYRITHFEFKKIFQSLMSKMRSIIYSKDLSILTKNEKEYRIFDNSKKICVYTCITGNYDKVYNPILKEKNVDYILFTNNDKIESTGYEVHDIPKQIKEKNMNNILLNRYIKMHPFELFENDYDYSIYIDGNIRVVSNISCLINEICDNIGLGMHKHSMRHSIYDEALVLKHFKKGNYTKIKKQMEKYRKENFPENFGMAEANVIVTDLKKQNAKKLLEDWWNEFISSQSMRDQLSLPYIIWKSGYNMEDITTLGNNVFDNVKIDVNFHE